MAGAAPMESGVGSAGPSLTSAISTMEAHPFGRLGMSHWAGNFQSGEPMPNVRWR